MASPVGPNDFCQYKVPATATPCDMVTSLRGIAQNLCLLTGYLIGSDNLPSDALIADIASKLGTTVGGGGTSNFSAPSNVAATSDRTGDVKVTWSAVSSATSYTVFRGSTSDTASMEQLASGISGGDTTPKEYLDTGAVAGTIYFYALKANNSLNISGFSAVASGKRTSGSGFTPHLYANTVTPESYTTPVGATLMTAELWGPGGTGGVNVHSGAIIAPNTLAYAGGGAGGSYMKITSIPISSSGEVWILDPAAPGSQTTIYKATLGSPVNAYATPGGNGGNARSYSIPGSGGAPASTAGANNLGIGTVDGDSTAGNAGSAGTTTVAGAGGAAIPSDDGGGVGAGSDGTNYATSAAFGGIQLPAPPGESGQIRLTFA